MLIVCHKLFPLSKWDDLSIRVYYFLNGDGMIYMYMYNNVSFVAKNDVFMYKCLGERCTPQSSLLRIWLWLWRNLAQLDIYYQKNCFCAMEYEVNFCKVRFHDTECLPSKLQFKRIDHYKSHFLENLKIHY